MLRATRLIGSLFFTYRLAAVVLASAVAISGQNATENKAGSEAAFKQLLSLAGEWEGTQEGSPGPIKETYTLVANGSTLMAVTKAAGESEMITMFTVDGNRLIATHYCNALNQPEMIASNPQDLRTGLTFSFARVTGMKTPDDWHNTALTITLDDHDHMTQRWGYLYKGKTGTSVFHYARKK